MIRSLTGPILISAALHSAFIFGVYHVNILRSDTEKPLVVEYVGKIELDVPQSEVRLRKVIESAKVEIKKDITPKPVPPKEQARQEAGPKQLPATELAQKQAKVRSTKEYIGYYQLIREKIRQSLKRNYRQAGKEGDVFLTFTLRSDGIIERYGYEPSMSVQDQRLIKIALKSLGDAAPFPRFPKAFDVSEMSFNLLVSFRKNK